MTARPVPVTVALGVGNIDDCVRMVTAFSSFEDMKDTGASYFPKFYTRAVTTAESIAQRRVVSAWNAWALRNGRKALAFVAKPGSAS